MRPQRNQSSKAAEHGQATEPALSYNELPSTGAPCSQIMFVCKRLLIYACAFSQVNACVKRQGHSGEWEVIVTNQNALHNHHINKTIFKSYVENRRITDPALLNGIMRLHFQGVKCKGVMEYIHKHSDIEPKPKDIHNLIRKLVHEGWTADRCIEEDPEEVTHETPQEESRANGDESSANKESSNSSHNGSDHASAQQVNASANNPEERPRIDSVLLAEIQKLATSGASGQQILEFISSQAAGKP